MSDIMGILRPDYTKEIVKTRHASTSARREYIRMREEQAAIRKSQGNAVSFIFQEKPVVKKEMTVEDAVKQSQPDVQSFPFVDQTDESKKDTKAVDANEHPGHKHGARLCMISAMMHMKCLASRRAKSIQQLRRNPKTSLDERLINVRDYSPEIVEEDDEVSKLRKCRYLRGVKEDRELTIEEIFSS